MAEVVIIPVETLVDWQSHAPNPRPVGISAGEISRRTREDVHVVSLARDDPLAINFDGIVRRSRSEDGAAIGSFVSFLSARS